MELGTGRGELKLQFIVSCGRGGIQEKGLGNWGKDGLWEVVRQNWGVRVIEVEEEEEEEEKIVMLNFDLESVLLTVWILRLRTMCVITMDLNFLCEF